MNLFHKLNFVNHDIVDLIKKEAANRTDWFESNGFDLLRLDNKLFFKTSLLELILKYKGNPVCINMRPMTWYDWHVDETRQCTINMLLEGHDSKCFFGDRQSRDIVNLTELPYEIGSAYLLNTQTKHAVLNLSKDRYLLSIGFDKPATYDNILNYCTTKKI